MIVEDEDVVSAYKRGYDDAVALRKGHVEGLIKLLVSSAERGRVREADGTITSHWAYLKRCATEAGYLPKGWGE